MNGPACRGPATGGEEHHRNLPELGVRMQGAEHFQPRKPRQQHVQDDQVGALGLHGPKGLGPIAHRAHLKGGASEVEGHQGSNVGLIVHHQDAGTGAVFGSDRRFRLRHGKPQGFRSAVAHTGR
jgi:hypothetical protein